MSYSDYQLINIASTIAIVCGLASLIIFFINRNQSYEKKLLKLQKHFFKIKDDALLKYYKNIEKHLEKQPNNQDLILNKEVAIEELSKRGIDLN